MKKYLIIIIALIGIVGLFPNCEKEGTDLVLNKDTKNPNLTLPDLNYTRDKGNADLVFKGTPVNPGYKVSAKYSLEVCAKGDDFKNVTQLYSGVQCDKITIRVADFNQKLLNSAFKEDEANELDFRLRAELVADAGTGNTPLVYTSTTQTASVTPFGLLRLDLIGSGIKQKIVSPAGDGKYRQFVKLDPSKAFTLSDPETGKSYGVTGGTLAENGSGITVAEAGWYDLSVNIKEASYVIEKYFIGCVGSATANAWGVPDQKMDYDAATSSWKINLDLTADEIKFRKNDSWGWNFGLANGESPIMKDNVVKGNLEFNTGNIPVPEAGNYDITFTVLTDKTGTFELKKN